MKTNKNYILYPLRCTLNQKGFSPILLVVLLAAGIIAGTLLVQNGVNFIPRADEQEGLNPSAGKTKNCGNEENKDQCQKENDVICAKDTVTYCDNRTGSPRAIRKSGGYYDPTHANTDPDSGCVFDYREVSGKSSECGKSESKSGDVVYTTKEEAQKLDSDRKSTAAQRERASGTGQNVTDAQCTEPGVKDAMKDEKVTGNLVRFYAILAGQPNYCVPADLGVEPKLTANATNGQSGRLMLCSGADGSLTWRVIVGNQLVLANKKTPGSGEDIKSELDSYIQKALAIATSTQPAAPQTNQSTETSNRPPIIQP